MNFIKWSLGLLAFSAGVLLVTRANPRGAIHARAAAQSSATDAGETAQAKIARAMSAGPTDIAKSAKIIDTDSHGDTVVLREGNNGFTCMPGNPKVVGEPPMCVDAPSSQWFADAKASPYAHLHVMGRP